MAFTYIYIYQIILISFHQPPFQVMTWATSGFVLLIFDSEYSSATSESLHGHYS